MIIHMSMSVEGGIRNAEDLAGCIEQDGKTLETAAEVRTFLKKHLAAGRRVIPMSDCLGFDFQKGCPGHSKEESERHSKIMQIARTICEEEKTCERWCGTTDDCEAYRKAARLYEALKDEKAAADK